MRNVSENICSENQNTHFVFDNFSFENRGHNEIVRRNVVDSGRPQMKIWSMGIACWIPTITNIHSEYVILTAFTLKQ